MLQLNHKKKKKACKQTPCPPCQKVYWLLLASSQSFLEEGKPGKLLTTKSCNNIQVIVAEDTSNCNDESNEKTKGNVIRNKENSGGDVARLGIWKQSM